MADLAAARATDLARADTQQFYDWFFEQRATSAEPSADDEPADAKAAPPAAGEVIAQNGRESSPRPWLPRLLS